MVPGRDGNLPLVHSICLMFGGYHRANPTPFRTTVPYVQKSSQHVPLKNLLYENT